MHPEFDDSLAGHDPAGFFGADASDLPALKRAYTALIRKWKPEKFPEEFKRVRSAYERLLAEAPAAARAPGPTASAEEKNAQREPMETPESADSRPASEIFETETRDSAVTVLEKRGPLSVPDILALSRLRAADVTAWPGYDLKTLADALMTPRPGNSDNGPLVATVERILFEAPADRPRETLDVFSVFEAVPFYFDITTDLWIAYSRQDPDVCLMRLDRLVHFTEVGRQNRLPYFLLRFCTAGAMRLPPSWIRRQLSLAARFPGHENASTPESGRLASQGPLGPGARPIFSEFDFMEAFLATRETLEADRDNRDPIIPYYFSLLSAYCDRDAEKCVASWLVIAGRTADTYVPQSRGAQTAAPVMLRIRESLDALLVRPEAPAVSQTAFPEKAFVVSAYYGTFLTYALTVITLVPLLMTGILAFIDGDRSKRLEPGLILFGAAVLIAIGTWFYLKILRPKIWIRILLLPLVISAQRGRVSLLTIRAFLCTRPALHEFFSTGSHYAYRVTVFHGMRTAPLRVAYGLIKDADLRLRPRLLRRRSAE